MNILITGGASGLGKAITNELAADTKHHIYFTFSKSKAAAEELCSQYPNIVPIKCDFKLPVEVDQLCEKIATLEIDVLINNVYHGDFLKSHFHKIAAEDFLTSFQNNIIPAIKITQAVIPGFRKRKSGKIITILTSALVNTPPVGASVYVADKGYLQQLSKVWAVENAKFNITSNTISPSFMKTSFTESMDERMVEQIIDGHPLKSILTPVEVAKAVAFLIYSGNHINGTDILINAGQAMK